MSVSPEGSAVTTACPICKKPAEPKYRPFCSSRCAHVDLQRWLSGSYVLPGDELDDEDAGRDEDT
jgi:endogenous inhibitor of DNA gyrase (YacG/DUF329 family)